MRLPALAILALAPLAASAAPPASVPPVPDSAARGGEILSPARPFQIDQMNAYADRPGCRSIPQQVDDLNGSAVPHDLNREPPGRPLLAVDRQIGGCHEVTLVSGAARRPGR